MMVVHITYLCIRIYVVAIPILNKPNTESKLHARIILFNIAGLDNISISCLVNDYQYFVYVY